MKGYRTNDHSLFKPANLKLKEHLYLWGLFFLTVFVIYSLPAILGYLFFFIVFILFFHSKKNYFWLAFFLLLHFSPLGLFNEGSKEAINRLPLFSFGGGISFSTLHIFLLIGLAKAIFLKNKPVRSYFKKHYILLLLYMLLLLLIAIFIHKTKMSIIVEHLKFSFNIFFVFIIYKLIYLREEKYKFVFLLVPFTFLISIDAFYFLLSGGNYLYEYIHPDNISSIPKVFYFEQGAKGIRFHINGFLLSYMAFIFSLSFSFLLRKKKYFLFVAMFSFLAVVAGAMRSWFVIYIIAFLFYIFYSTGKFKIILYVGIVGSILILPIMQSSIGKYALSGTLERINTVFTIGEESSSATQSIESRIENDLPGHLKKIGDSPITGWGFTQKMGNGDTGNFALLVDVGFLGFFLFLWFWISYINLVRSNIKKINNSDLQKTLKMLFVLFFGVMLSHFTTNQMFGIYKKLIFIGLFVFFSEFLLFEVNRYQQLQNNQS